MNNSVTFLFELELKQFKLSKILPIWKIDVYIVLLVMIKIRRYQIIIIINNKIIYKI